MIPISLFAQDKEKVVSLLYDNDMERTRFGSEIVLIEEFNFGIPGGVNWLVGWYGYDGGTRRNYTMLMVYVVDVANKEVQFRQLISSNDTDVPSYMTSWYKSLPCVTVDNGQCQIGDFNGDGIDDILRFHDGEPGPSLRIRGYNSYIGEIVSYCSLPCLITRQDDQPPPVEFITYKGMYGFKVQYHEGPQVAGGPGWVPDPPSPRNNRWYFYTWNEDRREYVEVEEVNPAYIEETYVNTGEWRNIQPTFPSVLAAPEPEAVVEAEIVVDDLDTAIYENDDERSNQQPPFWVWAAIGGGALLIICVVVIIKRKR